MLAAAASYAATLWQFLVTPLASARHVKAIQELNQDGAIDLGAGYWEQRASRNRQLLAATLSQAGVPELVMARLLRASQMVGAGYRRIIRVYPVL